MEKNIIIIGEERLKIDNIIRYKPYDYCPINYVNSYYIEIHSVYFDKKDIIKIPFNSKEKRDEELVIIDKKLAIS